MPTTLQRIQNAEVLHSEGAPESLAGRSVQAQRTGLGFSLGLGSRDLLTVSNGDRKLQLYPKVQAMEEAGSAAGRTGSLSSGKALCRPAALPSSWGEKEAEHGRTFGRKAAHTGH